MSFRDSGNTPNVPGAVLGQGLCPVLPRATLTTAPRDQGSVVRLVLGVQKPRLRLNVPGPGVGRHNGRVCTVCLVVLQVGPPPDSELLSLRCVRPAPNGNRRWQS